MAVVPTTQRVELAALPSVGEPRRESLVPGLAVVIAASAVAWVVAAQVSAVSTLVVAVAIGAAVGNSGLAIDLLQPGLAFAAKRLLRAGIVLLGLRLSLGDMAALGVGGIVVVTATVGVTFFGTQIVGNRLGLSRDLSLLVATGFSICGASAIAAVEGSTDADDEEVAAAIGLVTLFGSLAIVVLPAVAAWVGLNDSQFGSWAGASVHDVAQVAATASSAGAGVVAIAMAVKLTRVVLLTPIVIGVNMARRDGAAGDRPPLLPLFVAGFVTMVVVRTTGWLPSDAVSAVRVAEGWLLTAALVGLGAGVRFARLRRLGPRPLLLGAIAWMLVATVSLGGIILVS